MTADMQGVLVRAESPADVAGIRAVHQAAFPTPAEAALVDGLRAAGELSLSLVALSVADWGVAADPAHGASEPTTVIAHVGFSPIHVDGAALGMGLAPVAVQAEHRGRGVAAQLICEGLRWCREAGEGLVLVLGEPLYYRRFGFAPARLLSLRDEYHAGDAFQALELVRGTAPASGGLVQYSPVFAQLGV